MNVVIRGGEPRDVDVVLGLMKQLAEQEGLSEFFRLNREVLSRSCFAEPRRMELIVAEVEGEVVGYATCLVQFSPWLGCDYLFLDDLYVHSGMRGQGVGARLMRSVGALALERGVEVRWHVEVENRAAQKFYRAVGAELRDKVIAYWTADAIASMA